MENKEFRAVIKHFYMKGYTPQLIKDELDSVHGDNAPSYSTVKSWVQQFKMGRSSTEDEQRSGRPKTATTIENIRKIFNEVTKDRRIKLRELADIVKIHEKQVWSILHDELHMKKLSARWVPRLLTLPQKIVRWTNSEELLAIYQRNPIEFLRRFITVDETWIHHYIPECKEQSKQWIEAGKSGPKKAKTVKSAGKVMATVFWDARGIIFIDYLEKGKTINSEYYCALLDRLSEEIKIKRPHLAKKKVLFHQDNAPSHTAFLTQQKLAELRFEIAPHPPYSPDLAPSDYFLFPNLKKFLAGKKFSSNSEVIAETEAYFEGLEKSYFSDGIKKLEKRLMKCIELEGDYVEK